MSDGIIYYNKGLSCVPRLLVSLSTLRNYSKKDITLFLEGENLQQLEKDIVKNLNINVIYDKNPNTTTYVRSVEICMKSPYDNSVWIDADTTIEDNFDEIFDQIPQYDICIPHFANWRSDGSGIARRIRRFKGLISDNMIEQAISYGPAINCGVFGFTKNNEFLQEWLTIAKLGEKKKVFIPDEVACQILLPKYKTKILDPKYNVSVKYGDDIIDPKIIHYHGKKHCRSFSKSGVWIKKFFELFDKNFCNIKEYTKEDKHLKIFLHNHNFKLISDNENDSINTQTTIVTACDTEYVECLKLTLPTWIKYKNITQFPMIVYVNGFSDNDQRLDFLKKYSNIKIIRWDMHNVDNHREKMLSAFVYGPAKDVKTKYWLKIDADTYATNNESILNNKMKNYDIVGHKWGYTKPYKWIETLNTWSEENKKLNFKFDILAKQISKNRYYHHRTNSYVQLHSTEFTKVAANLSRDKLPIPSQDTYLWYIATALKKPMLRYNFKKNAGLFNRRGVSQLENIAEIKALSSVKLHLGCGKKKYDGWINTNKDNLNITNYQDWIDNKLFPGSVDRILTEHVLEHLSDEDRRSCLSNFKLFIKPNEGIIRIAVPDGYHPDKSYIDQVKVLGCGKSADDHKFLYNYLSLIELFTKYGFEYNLLEYFDENGLFHYKFWDTTDGFIKRSSIYDRRNKRNKLKYTSLIVDFSLPLKL